LKVLTDMSLKDGMTRVPRRVFLYAVFLALT